MTQVPLPVASAARRLVAREALNSASPESVAETMALVFARLRVGLGRWIGIEGYKVLLGRVFDEAQAEHPSLVGLRSLTEGGKEVEEMVRVHGAGEVSRACVSVVALLIHLLSVVIGEEIATRLVEQAWDSVTAPEMLTEKRGSIYG